MRQMGMVGSTPTGHTLSTPKPLAEGSNPSTPASLLPATREIASPYQHQQNRPSADITLPNRPAAA